MSMVRAMPNRSPLIILYRNMSRIEIFIRFFSSSTRFLRENRFLIPLIGFSLLNLGFTDSIVKRNLVWIAVLRTPTAAIMARNGKITIAIVPIVSIPIPPSVPMDNSSTLAI